MYIPGRSRTGCRPLRIEMSLAAYATRLPFRRAPAELLVSVLPTPRSGTRKAWSEGVSPVLPLYQNGGSPKAVAGLFGGCSEARHDDPNRGHDTGPAAPVRALHDLLFRVPQLRGPAGPIDCDRADSVSYRTNDCVRHNGGADDLRPCARQRCEGIGS